MCLACKLYFKTKRLAHIWGQVTAAYKDLKVDHGERVPDLKFFKIAECGVGRYPSQFPCLTCKAAHCKHLLRALRIVCERTPCRTLEESLRLKLMCDITRFVDILESNGRYLPREAADDAYCAVTSTLCTYVKLSSLAYVLHRKLWNIVPKFHYLWHIGRNTYTYNPRTSWVFREEDFVGRIRRIAASASHGHASISLATPIMNKYRQGIEIRMRRRMEFGWYCVAQHWDESRWPFFIILPLSCVELFHYIPIIARYNLPHYSSIVSISIFAPCVFDSFRLSRATSLYDFEFSRHHRPSILRSADSSGRPSRPSSSFWIGAPAEVVVSVHYSTPNRVNHCNDFRWIR